MWTKEEEEIIKQHHGKITLAQIHKLYFSHKTYYALRGHAQRLGLFRMDRYSNTLPSKNTFNYEYWKELTPVNCYLAGLIMTDGCIMSRGKNNIKRFSYRVAIKDESIIDLFIKELNFVGKKRYATGRSPSYPDRITRFAQLSIRSFNKNAEYLKQYFNIVPLKTNGLKPPNFDDRFLNFCVQIGAYDGDGTIGIINRNGKLDPYLSICSVSKDFCMWFKRTMDKEFCEYIYREANIAYHKRAGLYSFGITGLRAAIIIDYLRQIPVPKLARKWDNIKVLELIDEKKKRYPHFFKTLEIPPQWQSFLGAQNTNTQDDTHQSQKLQESPLIFV